MQPGHKAAQLVPNTVLFCKRPWRIPAFALTAALILTFIWGFYLIRGAMNEGEVELEEFAIRGFYQESANPDIQFLYDAIPPAVVGISGPGINSGTLASGAIVGSGGYVLTTLHSVVELPAINVMVKTPQGVRRYDATIVKSMPDHDIVLLKMLTQDRFLYLTLADTQVLQTGDPVFGFGQGIQGNALVRPGSLTSINMTIQPETIRVSHLLGTNAIYTWEQSGGPLVNGRGELVGISIAVTRPNGTVEGFAVPSHVIMAHFQDVLKFKLGKGTVTPARAPGPQAAGTGASNAPSVVQVAGMVSPAGSGGMTGGSAAWWAKAQAQVSGSSGPLLGMNIAGNNVGVPPMAGAMGGNPAAAAMMLDPGISAGILDPEHLLGPRIGGHPLENILGLALLALVAGITGGMMTMGGGVIQVAGMMVFFGYGMYLIRPVAYLTNIFVYGASAYRNHNAGLVMWDNVRALAPWAVVGVVVGYFIGNSVGEVVIYYMLGIFALLMAIKAFMEIFVDDQEQILIKDPSDARRASDDEIMDDLLATGNGDQDEQVSFIGTPENATKHAALGLPMGLISGILGISGGVVEVPLQRYLGKVPLRNAIANSSVLVFWASVGGAIVAFSHGISTGLIEWQTPITLALIMIPGAYFGGILGAKLMKVLPIVALKWLYMAIMLAIAVKMLFFRP
ncbi:MAG: trypsin-like serine protease [Gammaproteobacteria bacterium]|nr:MAG: trypsin-like serine protease [Gammaproteobacteria bacterium]TND04352.1 MAG: trypsin-like serine protease [Gammaproteobacteria bacterium]